MAKLDAAPNNTLDVRPVMTWIAIMYQIASCHLKVGESPIRAGARTIVDAGFRCFNRLNFLQAQSITFYLQSNNVPANVQTRQPAH